MLFSIGFGTNSLLGTGLGGFGTGSLLNGGLGGIFYIFLARNTADNDEKYTDVVA